MAISFGTTRGVMELADTGPTSRSKISARADIEVRSVTAVFEVTDVAAKAWRLQRREDLGDDGDGYGGGLGGVFLSCRTT